MFRFVVSRLHWLSRVPLAPQFFDAWLVAWTAMFRRERLKAMQDLEAAARELPGVELCVHRFGGVGFMRSGEEFAHLHGNGLLDVRLTRERAAELFAVGRAVPHHRLGVSRWISFWLRNSADLDCARSLLIEGAAGCSQLGQD